MSLKKKISGKQNYILYKLSEVFKGSVRENNPVTITIKLCCTAMYIEIIRYHGPTNLYIPNTCQ